MSGWRSIRLAAQREIRERLRTREFRASTAIQALVVIGIVIAIGATTGDDSERYELGTVGAEAATIAQAARAGEEALDVELELRRLEDEAAAEAEIADEEIDAAIAGDRLLAGSSPPETLVALIQGATREVRAAERLREEGLSETSIREALDPPPLAVTETGDDRGSEGLALLVSLLLFVAIMGFGIYLATGVVEEKSSRVVELILAAVRPIQLLGGKVVGIGLLGLGQVLVIAGAGLVAALSFGSVDLPESTASTVVLAAVFFVLGYLLYASAFAVAGAIVSRAEDVQSTTGPLTLILIVAYVASVNLIDAPDSPLAVILTLVPATAPMVAPLRAAQDALPAWELALSIVLVVAAAVALIWLAARIYERAVLQMGAPLKLRQALRLVR